MAKRLVIIAKQLNVGTTTIVEHLNNSGFEIDNKPTAKISDEMYSELLKHFSNEIAVKEQADQLTIGHRQGKEDEAQPEGPAAEPKPAEAKAEEPKPAVAEAPVESKAQEAEKEEAAPAEKEEEEAAPKIKLVGKIDLEAVNRKKEKPAPVAKEETAAPEKAPEQKAEAEPAETDDQESPQNEVEKGEPAATTEAEETDPEKSNELLRAKTPKLKLRS